MYQLYNGQWRCDGFTPNTEAGAFARPDSRFRQWIENRPDARYPAEPGRYHLYVSLACPWAHRTLILRKLKRLEQVISVDIVAPHMADQGWVFDPANGGTHDSCNGFRALYQAYQLSDPNYTGLVTVPVLWDKQTHRIVNNESSEIIRMLNSAFDAWGDASVDLYPEPLRDEIDEINQRVYRDVNNGVYRAGFATKQSAYERAVRRLFTTLEWLDNHLQGRRFLVGGQLTEADIRLFTTLVRFDAVYHGHFKCNLKQLVDFANLAALAQRIYRLPGVAETTDFDHIKRHYYGSHPSINPTGLVPAGPVDRLFSE